MSKRIGGLRRRTRGELSKPKNMKGKVSLRKYLAVFKEGDRVVLKMDPSCGEGVFHARFMGKSGVVSAKKGSCYEVMVKDASKEKALIVHPIHMKKCA